MSGARKVGRSNKRRVQRSTKRAPRPGGDSAADRKQQELSEARRLAKEAEQRLQAERAARAAEAQRLAELKRRRAVAAPPDSESDDNYSDEEFDDYSDDGFDDYVETKPPSRAASASPASAELLKALQQENAAAKAYGSKSSSAAPTSYKSHTKSSAPASGGIAARGRKPPVAKPSPYKAKGGVRLVTKSSTRGKGRSQRVRDLKKLISLSEDSFEIFNQPPLEAIDVYMRTVRSGIVRQTQSQTNDDARSIRCQTEVVEVASVGMQFPDDIGFGASGAKLDAQQQAAKSLRLSKFLRSATAVCEALLEENLAGDVRVDNTRTATDEAPTELAARSVEFKPELPLLANRRVADACFSVARPNNLMCAYGPASDAAERRAAQKEVAAGAGAGTEGAAREMDADAALSLHAGDGLLCVWDVFAHSQPQQVLVCPGTPLCCTFSPNRAHVAIAGTAEGSLVVWDLRESNNMHRSQASLVLGVDSGLRQPSHSTDNMATMDGVNIARIVKVVAFDTTSSTTASSEDEKTSFQVASLDDRGNMVFWVAIELPAGEWGVSETDLGLGIGARVKLVKSVTVTTSVPFDTGAAISLDTALLSQFGPCVETMELLPQDVSRFLVGTSNGKILQQSRFGQAPAPHVFEAPFESLSAVTSISVSRHHPQYFLAGYANGVVCLFQLDSPLAVAVWDDATGKGSPSVVRLSWSDRRPAVFFVLDSASQLHVWDLLSNDTAPVLTEKVVPAPSLAMAVSSSEWVKTHKSTVCIATVDGRISVQVLAHAVGVPTDTESEILLGKLQSIL